MNNHFINGTEQFTVGFIDSGTTFTYLPGGLWTQLVVHFDWFCGLDKDNHCKGNKVYNPRKSNTLCFAYDERKFPDGPKAYFSSFPILNIRLRQSPAGDFILLAWYPSEYLYRDKPDQYCLAAEKYTRGEILIGGTLMRQHNFIFDIDGNRLGVARARCNEDPNQVLHAEDMVLAGQRYGLDPTHVESLT